MTNTNHNLLKQQ